MQIYLLEGKWKCGICVCFAFRIKYAKAINWATMTFSLVDVILTNNFY